MGDSTILIIIVFLQIYVGGVPNIQEGLEDVVQNFTGCIENLYLNATNVIRQVKNAYESYDSLRFEKVNTMYSCPVRYFEKNDIELFK